MKKINVALVEDHSLVRDGIRKLVQGEKDMEVLWEASDGEEACQLADQTIPDIILMDIAMPKLNGIEATRRIKKSHPEVGIIILTAYDNMEFILAFIEAGAAGYLLKYSESSDLLNGIRAVYLGGSMLDPIIVQMIYDQCQPKKREITHSKEKHKLTQREVEVLEFGMEGLSNVDIALELAMGVRTVQTHWRNIFDKLGVGSRTEAVICALREGWITFKKGIQNG